MDKKLAEEVIEYIKENTIEELADIFEVLYPEFKKQVQRKPEKAF